MTTFCSLERSFIRLAISLELYTKITPNKKQFVQNSKTLGYNIEPWWILTYVCKVLELSNPSRVAERLDDDERSNFELGRQGKGIIINESGLYSVILRSDKPQAKSFKRWVTHEALPSIRQTGSYSTLQAPVSDFDSLSRRMKRWRKKLSCGV